LLAGGGVVAGMPAAVAATGVIRSLLFGLAPTDPVTMGLPVLLMVAIAIAAARFPWQTCFKSPSDDGLALRMTVRRESAS